MTTRYDHPNCVVRREAGHTTVAGNAAVSARFFQYQKFRLKNIHVMVAVAGTTAGNTLLFKNGTTALTTCTLGTNTAGYTTSLGIAADVPSLQALTATNGTDATGQAVVSYEFYVENDAVQTA